MTRVTIARGSHSVRFYESGGDAYRSIADYFLEDARHDDCWIMLARADTLAGVRGVLETSCGSETLRVGDRIRFVDADTALAEFVRGDFDRERAEELFIRLLSEIPAGGENTRVRLYGELVDVLCERGQHAIALQLEDLAGLLFTVEPRLSILCGYYIRHFAVEPGAAVLRSICGKHTDIGPLPDAIDALRAPGDKTGLPGFAAAAASSPIVYVVDDDASMRRSLARLLALSNWPVRTFDSAEAFLKEADWLSEGCVVVDIQLGGMSGLDFLAALAARGYGFPVIAMSGFHDERFESAALRLGAKAFLHKPFEPRHLLDVIADTLRRMKHL